MLSIAEKAEEKGEATLHVLSGYSSKPSISFQRISNRLQIEIETERLLIRSYVETDFENCVLLYGNEINTRYFDYGKPRTRHEVEKLIQERGNKYFFVGEPFGLFSIYSKKSMDFIGQIDLLPSEEFGAIEIGFILCRKFHNQGFCTEAVRAIVFEYTDFLNNSGEFVCDYLPINKIIATVHPENKSSRRVLEKLGMTLDKIQDRFGAPRLWYSISVSLIAQKIGAR